jgi:hypothetical protein
MNKLRLISFAVLLLSSCVTQSQELDQRRIKSHIDILASDNMKGRGTGTEGEKTAAKYIVDTFSKLKLTPSGDGTSYTQAFEFTRGMHGVGEMDTAYNVIGFLDNKAKTTIIIGAHYDHLGNSDGQGSSLDANPSAKIHNGADDNASGVAGVLELAAYFSSNKTVEKSNFLFICFSGEELGLLGSKYFTEHSKIDLNSVDFMINLDMIGRLNPDTRTLIINGTGTSPTWEPVIKELKRPALNIITDSSGTGPSDQTSFYLKNIPAIHFFTGAHTDYHKPTDDAEKINAHGEVLILKFIIDLIKRLDSEQKLTFLKTKTRTQGSVSSFKVTMGIMPSYGSEVIGLKVDGVTEGKPAHKAGIQTGDIITQIGQYEIKDIYGYMDALGKFEKGQTVLVKLKRDEKEISLNLTF